MIEEPDTDELKDIIDKIIHFNKHRRHQARRCLRARAGGSMLPNDILVHYGTHAIRGGTHGVLAKIPTRALKASSPRDSAFATRG